MHEFSDQRSTTYIIYQKLFFYDCILKVITYARTMIHNVSKLQIGHQNLTNAITFFTRTLFLKIQ